MTLKVNVIQTAFVGDCVLSLPFLYRLAEIQRVSEIRVLTHPTGKALFELGLERGLAPFKAKFRFISYEKRRSGFPGFCKAVGELRSPDEADISFLLQRSLRSALLAFLSGTKTRVGFSSGSAGFLYNHLVSREWDSGKSEVEKNLDLLRSYFSERIPEWSPLEAPSLLSEGESLKAPLKTKKTNDDLEVALSLGSPWATKRWPLENAIPLVKKLIERGIAVKLLGDSASQVLGEEVSHAIPSILLKNLCGKTNLNTWIHEIETADLVVSGDSAAVHIASDLGVPVLALFGPTLPEFGFAPWRRNSKVLGLSSLYCRPCHIHGPRICPEGHHACLREIKAEQVFDAVLNSL